ncbi:MAG: hypothetical protein JWL73_3420 [Actinomycetia bacterium]|nr:hypothetical protein [Actinomycetes bacterium]
MAEGVSTERAGALAVVAAAWARLGLRTQVGIGCTLALLVAAAFVLIGAPAKLDNNPIVPNGSTRGTVTTIPTRASQAQDDFLAGIRSDVTLRGLDDRSVSRSELLAAGRRFCTDVAIPAPGDRRTGGPTSADFRRVADRIATGFTGVKDSGRSGSANGPTLLAYSVGQSAVTTLCPENRSALG